MNYQVDDAGNITTTTIMPVEDIIERLTAINVQIAELQQRADELTDLVNRASLAPNISADRRSTIQTLTGVTTKVASL